MDEYVFFEGVYITREVYNEWYRETYGEDPETEDNERSDENVV